MARAARRQPRRPRGADPALPPGAAGDPRHHRLRNSSAGLLRQPTWGAYAASKFGLRALADTVRAEEIETGVRVTSVFLSRTATPMQEKVHEQEGRTYDATKWITPETVADTVLHVLDLPRDTTIPEVTVRPVVPRPT